MSSRVKALVVPIFRRYWLWNAWSDPAAEAATQQAVRSWRQGATLEEKFQLLGHQLTSRAQARLLAEWRKLESAKEGTIRSWGYRLAQAVLSREDPRETFLKQIPTVGPSRLDIIYPDAFAERLVRRRLRLVARHGHHRHRRRLLYWGLAIVPQLPLLVTPLPNITVYYTAYRIYSHYTALQGSKALEKGFAALDSQQLRALRDELLRVQAAAEGGLEYPPDSWPARLIRKECGYLDIFDRLRRLQQQRRLEAQPAGGGGGSGGAVPAAAAVLDAREGRHGSGGAQEGGGGGPGAEGSASSGVGTVRHSDDEPGAAPPGSGALEPPAESEVRQDARGGLALCLRPSAELTRLVQPAERAAAPLSDEAALAAGAALGAPHLLTQVARARRRVVGAMFPANSADWEAKERP